MDAAQWFLSLLIPISLICIGILNIPETRRAGEIELGGALVSRKDTPRLFAGLLILQTVVLCGSGLFLLVAVLRSS